MGSVYAGKERRNRVVALVLAIVLVAGVVLSLLVTVAASAGAAPARSVPAAAPRIAPAHASLVSIAPADGVDLTTGPTEIRLTFDGEIAPRFAEVLLTSDGRTVDTGPPAVDRTVVVAPVTGTTGRGAYRVAWRVTSTDGHRLSGESSFTVGGAAAHGLPTYKTPQTQPTTFGSADHLPGLVAAVVLLLGGVVLLVHEHRRRARGGGPRTGAGDERSPGTEDRQRIS